MYQFFATIHARPEEVGPGRRVALGEAEFETLTVPPALLAQSFDRDFEQTLDVLTRWERMFTEPDGSFVWVSAHDEPAWQVDGNLYDRDELLLFVDVKGACPSAHFDRLLGALGWPETPLMFQLTHEAVFLSEAEFRRFAGSKQPQSESR